MYKAVEALGQFVRSLVSLAVLGAIGFGGWIAYHDYYLPSQGVHRQLADKQAEVDRLAARLSEKEQELERLNAALRLLKVDHRVAQMAVLNQWRRPQDDRLMTTLGFAEVDDEGNFLDGYRTYTIEGNVVYIDAWVAKFMDDYVEQGVPLRSTSLCLFRRLFGEDQRPNDGFVLDAVGSRPLAYSRGREMTDLETEIWGNFWEYANDPEQARSVGLRALQGEAPSIRLAADKVYWIYLRASDGLTIKAADRQVRPLANNNADTAVKPAAYTEPPFAARPATGRAVPNASTSLPTNSSSPE